MKQKMNKLMYYMWYYFWNVLVVYLLLVPVYTVILLSMKFWKSLGRTFYEIKDALEGQEKVNEKKILRLQDKFKEKVI